MDKKWWHSFVNNDGTVMIKSWPLCGLFSLKRRPFTLLPRPQVECARNNKVHDATLLQILKSAIQSYVFHIFNLNASEARGPKN